MFNPFSQQFRRNPYEVYSRLRRGEGFGRELTGYWLALDWGTVHASLRSPSLEVLGRPGDFLTDDPSGTARRPAGGAGREIWEELRHDRFRMWLVFQDGHWHRRLRRAVRPLTRVASSQWLAEVIDGVVSDLLEGLVGRRRFDVMEDFSSPLALDVVCAVLGVPGADKERIRRLARTGWPLMDGLVGRNDRRSVKEALDDLEDYCYWLVDGAIVGRGKPSGLVAQLIRESSTGGSDIALSVPMIGQLVAFLIAAGYDTTANLIGNIVAEIAGDHEVISGLKQGDQGLVDELIRLHSSVQLTARRVTDETELGGAHLAPGDYCVLALGAANRDPSVFRMPDRASPGVHGVARSLAFGAGGHACLGAGIARAETALALRRLFEAFPKMAVEALNWRRSVTIRGIESLEVRAW